MSTLILLVGSLAGALQAQTLIFGRRTYLGNTTYTHADLNNDGREDLVYPTVGASVQAGFTVVLTNGNGTYAAPVFYASPTGVAANVLVMDINRDGYPNIFAWTGGNQFYEYLNNKSGALSIWHSFQPLARPAERSRLLQQSRLRPQGRPGHLDCLQRADGSRRLRRRRQG